MGQTSGASQTEHQTQLRSKTSMEQQAPDTKANKVDSGYLTAAEQLLLSVELACDNINEQTQADIDCARVGGMVTLEFRDSSQIVINLQKPLEEVWLASKGGGFHYRLSADGRWLDSKNGSEFFADLSAWASAHAGIALNFRG